MSILYWIFGVDASLRQSLPWLSVHDQGWNRGWTFVLSLFFLGLIFWVYRKVFAEAGMKKIFVLAGLRGVFFLFLLFILVHPVLVMTGEEVPGLPEIEKIDLAASPWILVVMILMLCAEWLLRRNWRLK